MVHSDVMEWKPCTCYVFVRINLNEFKSPKYVAYMYVCNYVLTNYEVEYVLCTSSGLYPSIVSLK